METIQLIENSSAKGYFARQLVRHVLDNANRDEVLNPIAAEFVQKRLEAIIDAVAYDGIRGDDDYDQKVNKLAEMIHDFNLSLFGNYE